METRGMGVVYRARDLNLNRSVAIKSLSTEITDETRRGRFQQEAQTASSLNHPNILVVYEAGTSEGRQCLITEFVDGWTLCEWVRESNRVCGKLSNCPRVKKKARSRTNGA